MSALLVPMSFALFDAEREGDDVIQNENQTHGVGPDPVRTLAAVQSYASRMTLYCERGRIAAAAKAPSLIGYLEEGEALQPVPPPRAGSFHPKLWVLRFYSNENLDLQVHRVLCLSRNLTFDRSWDTILRLEQAEDNSPGQTAPLIEFLSKLDSLASSEHARSLARSLRDVSFSAPKGFDSLTFCPLLPSDGAEPLGSGNELFVASPFISEGRIHELQGSWDQVRLASRADALDRLDPDLVRSLKQTYAFDGLNDGDAEPDARGSKFSPRTSFNSSSLVAANEANADDVGLSGLHAKVFSGRTGGRSFLLVGSANCTHAAFERNYEFCVRLDVKNKSAGPAALVATRKDNAGLSALLQPYTPKDEATEPSDQELELERLEDLRREIAAVPLEATAKRRADSSFELRLRAKAVLPSRSPGDTLRCWPITLGHGHAVEVGTPAALAKWRINSLVNVTGLIAFELKSVMNGVPVVSFTLKARLKGDIKGRLDAILADTLSDRERLMRFLLLLLAAGGDDQTLGYLIPRGRRNGRRPLGSDAQIQVPLLETLLRTFSREPGRLKAFERALKRVQSARDEGHALPDDLLEVWTPVQEALDASKRSSR